MSGPEVPASPSPQDVGIAPEPVLNSVAAIAAGIKAAVIGNPAVEEGPAEGGGPSKSGAKKDAKATKKAERMQARLQAQTQAAGTPPHSPHLPLEPLRVMIETAT